VCVCEVVGWVGLDLVGLDRRTDGCSCLPLCCRWPCRRRRRRIACVPACRCNPPPPSPPAPRLADLFMRSLSPLYRYLTASPSSEIPSPARNRPFALAHRPCLLPCTCNPLACPALPARRSSHLFFVCSDGFFFFLCSNCCLSYIIRISVSPSGSFFLFFWVFRSSVADCCVPTRVCATICARRKRSGVGERGVP
jgi:hypothetical protein